jgi:uncharacterized protein YukE
MSGKHGGHARQAPSGKWTDPVVGSKNLMVYGDQLTSVASQLSTMAGDLSTQLETWHASVTPVEAPDALGRWQAAGKLHDAVRRAHLGVRQFATDLADCHEQAAGKLKTSVENYLEAEHDNLAAIRKASEGDHKAITAELKGAAKGQRGKGTRIDANEKTWQDFRVRPEGFDKGSVAGYNYADIRDLLESTHPELISAAGAAHTALSQQLNGVTDQLVGHAQTLADNWSGETAIRAVGYVQKLHQTASDLQEKTHAVGQALSHYGPVLQHYKSTLPPGPQVVAPPQLPAGMSRSVVSTAEQAYNQQVAANASLADQAAQQHLAELNGHIETAYRQLPTEVRKNLPKVVVGAGSGSRQAPPGTAGGTPAAPGPGPSGPSPTPVPAPVPAQPPKTTPVTTPGPVQGGTRLASLPAGGTLISPSPVSPAGTGPVMPTGGASGELAMPGAGTGVGAGGWIDSPGAAGNSLTTQPAGGGSAEGAGTGLADGNSPGEEMTGFPMGGGAGGGAGGQDRVRQVWELEDGGTWQGPDEGPWIGEMPAVSADGVISADAVGPDVAGPVAVVPGDVAVPAGVGPGAARPWEGAAAPAGQGTANEAGIAVIGDPAADQPQNVPARQAWIDEIPDIWGDDGHGVTPVIG